MKKIEFQMESKKEPSEYENAENSYSSFQYRKHLSGRVKQHNFTAQKTPELTPHASVCPSPTR